MTYDDCIYLVIDNKALAIDSNGTPIICDVIQDYQNDLEYVDWDSADAIDWLDLPPSQYDLYKTSIDFLHQFNQSSIYIK